MNRNKIIKKIKSYNWDNKVQRPGFLQSKEIIIDAETHPIVISKNVRIKCDNQLWVKDFNLYEIGMWDSMSDKFTKAFQDDKKWPYKIFSKFKTYTKSKNNFIKEISGDLSKLSINQKKALFEKYIKLLKQIQQYYIIATPLTDYCEGELKKYASELLSYAFPYAKLDIDSMSDSLRLIRRERNIKKKEKLIKSHLKKFAWIKTAYNIIDLYTEKEVLDEIKSIGAVRNILKRKHVTKYYYLLESLQIGIYLRNRMKEMSQQLWFYVEPLCKSLAADFNILRDDFYYLLTEEVLNSVNKKKLLVNYDKINERRKGFVIGKVDDKKVFITGKEVKDLYLFANPKINKKIKIIKGNVSCKGKVIGAARVILKRQDFNKLKRNEILVTSMTTPDYVVIMKKAAAIITDEGGLSCHAAIVSRELGIPRVIGTKIATKILKDGDRIEVDANNGIIKILT